MKTDIEQYQKVCTDAGVQFIEADGQFVFFQDVITKEQLKVEVKKFNNQRAQAEVALHRKKYPKNIEMLSDFTDAIRFLAKKYHVVPQRAIDEAATAAAIIIKQYVDEQIKLAGGVNEKIAA